jgi:hypothetical protein
MTKYNKKKPEIIVDFNEDPYGKILININHNKSLSEQRSKLSLNNSSNNILFIFIDNISRNHFYRQFKKTAKFIKNFLRY